MNLHISRYFINYFFQIYFISSSHVILSSNACIYQYINFKIKGIINQKLMKNKNILTKSKKNSVINGKISIQIPSHGQEYFTSPGQTSTKSQLHFKTEFQLTSNIKQRKLESIGKFFNSPEKQYKKHIHPYYQSLGQCPLQKNNLFKPFHLKYQSISQINQYPKSPSEFFATQIQFNSHNSLNNSASEQKLQDKSSNLIYKNKFQPINKRFRKKKLVKLLSDVEYNQEILKEQFKSVYQDDYDFYKHYKEFDKIEQIENLCLNDQISPFQQMFKFGQDESILPNKMGILNSDYKPMSIIKNQNFILGDIKANMLSQGLKQFKSEIEKINMSGNNLTNSGAYMIVDSMGPRAKCLDLSSNKLSKNGNFSSHQFCEILALKISDIKYNLRELNLKGNSLGDQKIQILLQSCINQGSSNVIQKLNLSENLLTNKIAEYLKQFLIQSHEILELYLNWNMLGPPGSLLIAQALQEKNQLKVLDLKHNNMGGNELVVKEWAKVLENDNKSDLIHIDLSFNNYNKKESQIISEGIFNNHSIYGFHFSGNYGDIDSKQFNYFLTNRGFLKIPDVPKPDINNLEWQIQNNINGVHVLKKKGFQSNCWICEGFEEHTFYWRPYISGPTSIEPILIHFSFDNYEPHQMENKQTYFKFVKMCPPKTKINYFFTIAGSQYYSKEKSLKHEEVVEKNITIPYFDINVHVKVSIMNYVISNQVDRIIDEEYKPYIQTQPRIYEEIKYLIPSQNVKIPWTFENSIFKDYRRDDEEFIDKCFQKDWNDSRIEKILKPEEVPLAKIILKTHYGQIKRLYKQYSTSSPSGEIWAIGQNVYIEFMNNAKFIGNNYQSNQTSLNFVNTKAGNVIKKVQSDINNNPINSLIRFQFMEVIVRNIIDKYIKSGICQSFSDAWKQCLSDGLQEDFDRVTDEYEWKNQYYWTENTEICIVKFKNLIERLFKLYAGSKKQQNTKIKYMSLDDFRFFIQDCQFSKESLADREINIAYNMSMMSQIDEITSNRFIQMNQLEFFEAIVRLADVISPIPYGQSTQEEELWPIDIRVNLELCIKLESILATIHKKQDIYFREENKLSDVSLFNDELIAIKNGKEVAQRARKNLQNKVKSMLVRKQGTGAKKQTGIFGIIKEMKKQQLTKEGIIEFQAKTELKIQDTKNDLDENLRINSAIQPTSMQELDNCIDN